MPNWAYTSYAVEGPKETLQKIEQAILHHPVREGSSKDWEGNVLDALDIKWVSRDQDRENGLYMRGFIHEKPWWIDDSHSALRFCADEAWGATDLNEALEQNLPVKVFYSVEEEGEGIYATNDKEGKYFPDRLYIDTCIDGNYESEYFPTDEEALEWLRGHTKGKIKDWDDIDKFNEEYETLGTDDDNFIFVHEFKIV